MFGRKKKEKVDTVALPKLNDRVYEGSIESAFQAGRAQRKIKSLQTSPQEIFANYRRNLKMDITDGYARNLYAGFWVRLFAFVIDMIMVYALQALVSGLANVLTQGQYASLDVGILYVIKQVVLILYFTLASFFTNGQTIGKGLLGLQLVKDNQYKLSFMTCFVREGLGKFILATLPFLGLMVVFSSKRQNFMDYFTDTNVISLNQFAMLYEENVI
jgi:uncharacterized RDD family membrane protein YckC